MVTRSDPEKHREQVKAANRARYKAVQELIDNHRPEFNLLYTRHATDENVVPKPRQAIDPVEITNQIKQLEKQLAAVQSGNGVKPATG